MDEKKLTKKQKVVLQYIKKYVVSHGYAPTVREICQGLSLSSPATVHSHLSQLEGKGFIRKGKGKFRTIEVLCENEFVPKNEEVVKVPLLGKVTAGTPIEAIENPNEYFSFIFMYVTAFFLKLTVALTTSLGSFKSTDGFSS